METQRVVLYRQGPGNIECHPTNDIIRCHLFSTFFFFLRINRLLLIFLWGSKLEKAKREIILRKKHHGGIDFLDLEIFIWINYINNFVELYTKESKA